MPDDLDAALRWLDDDTYERFHKKEEDEHYKRAFSEPVINGAIQRKVHAPLDTVRASVWHGMDRPVRVWLDGRNLFRVGYVSILSGAGAVGKTLLALQASVACVTGTPWLAAPIKRGPVLFYSAEEPLEEMHIRLDEICEAEAFHLDQLNDLHLVDLNKMIDAALIYQGEDKRLKLTELFYRLDMTLTAIKPICLWLDNRSFIVTGNENDRNLATFAMRQLQLLAEKHGCAIIVLAHPSNAGLNDGSGASGSTAWFNTARSVVYMTKPKPDNDEEIVNPNARLLTNNKPNYSAPDKMVNVLWEFSRFVCTDEPIREEIGGPDKAQRVFMTLLRQYNGHHIRVSVSPFSRAYAPKAFSAEPKEKREDLRFKDFKAALAVLLESGAVINQPYGPKSDRTFELVAVT